MAYKQIPNLPPVNSLNGSELLEAVQAGVDIRLTTDQVATMVMARISGSIFPGRTSVFIADTAPVPPIANTLWWSSALGELFVGYQDTDSLQWVPASTGGDVVGAMVSVGTVPPPASDNLLWWNSELGQLFVYYNDGNSRQWVPAAPSGLPLGDATDWVDIVNKPSTFPPTPEAVDDRVAALLVAGSNISLTYNDVANTMTIAGTAGGTVTGVSVATANGFGGTVATSTTTPAITLTTSITGLLKGNGTAVSAAAAGTDYVTPAGLPTSLPPSGTATGDLTGSYPDPTIKSSVSLAGVPLLSTAVLAGVVANEIVTAAWVNAKGYQTVTGGNVAYAPISHTHPASQVSDFAEAVDDRVSALLVAGANISLTYNDVANTLTVATVGSAGSVTSVSVVSANGLAGTVATASTTPAITLTTTVTGLLKGSASAIVAATAGTDYVVPSALSGYLPLTGGTLSGPGDLTVTGLTATTATVNGAAAINITTSAGTPFQGITLTDLASRSDWPIDQVTSGITFASNDGSGVGVGNRLRFGHAMVAANGSLSNFVWEGAPTTAGTLVKLMTLTSGGVLTLTGTLFGTTGTFSAAVSCAALTATGTVNLSGAATNITGGILHLDRAADATNADFYMSVDPGFQNNIHLRTGTVDRWLFGKSATAEGADGVGSDFFIVACNNAGAGLTALTISRLTRAVTIAQSLTLGAGLTGTTGTFSGAVIADSFDAAAAGTGYSLAGTTVLIRANYTSLYDGKGVASIVLGYAGDANNFYRQTSHHFQDAGGGNTSLSIVSGTSATIQVPLTLSSHLNLAVGSVITWATRGKISTVGDGSWHITNNAGTAGSRLDFSTDATLTLSSTAGGAGNLILSGGASVLTAGTVTATGAAKAGSGFWSRYGSAIGAAAATQYFAIGSNAGTPIGIYYGTGTPTGVFSAQAGSLYLRQDGAANTRLYINTSGGAGTTWSAVTTP